MGANSMKSEDMCVSVINSQIELLKHAGEALLKGDFVTSGMSLKAVGSMCSQLGDSMAPFAALQFIMNKEESKAKMTDVKKHIEATHKMLLELFKNDTEGLPKQ